MNGEAILDDTNIRQLKAEVLRKRVGMIFAPAPGPADIHLR